MKEQILEISDKLKNDEITPEETQNLLLVLFGVKKESMKKVMNDTSTKD